MHKIFLFFSIFFIAFFKVFSQQPELLWQKNGSEIMATALSYSPDGKYLYIGKSYPDENKYTFSVEKWDLISGKFIMSTPVDHYVLKLAASDEYILASASVGSVQVIDAVSGKLIRRDGSYTGSNAFWVGEIAFLPDNSTYGLYSVGDNLIHIVSLNSGELLRQINVGVAHSDSKLHISGNGETAAYSSGSSVKIYNTQDGSLLRTIQFQAYVSGIDISFTGEFVAVAIESYTEEKIIKLYNTLTGELVSEWESDFNRSVIPVISPDGKKIIWTTGFPGTHAQGINVTANSSFVLDGTSNGTEIDPTSSFASTITECGSVEVWNIEDQSRKFVFADTNGLKTSQAVHSILFSRDGKYIYSGKSDGTIGILDQKTGDSIGSFGLHVRGKLKMATSPVENKILGFNGNTIKIWDVDSRELHKESSEFNNLITDASFTPNGQQILVTVYHNGAYIWDLQTDEYTRIDTSRTWLHASAFSKDGELLAIGGSDKKVKIFTNSAGIYSLRSVLQADTLQTYEYARSSGISAMTFSHDSKFLFTSSSENTIRQWDVEKEQVIAQLSTQKQLVVSSPQNHLFLIDNDKTLVMAGFEAIVQYVNVSDKTFGATIQPKFTGQPFAGAMIIAMDMSADQKHLVLVSDKGDIALYKTGITTSVEEVQTHISPEITVTPHPVSDIAYVTFHGEGFGEIVLYDRLDNIIDVDIAITGNSAFFKTGNIPSGLYFVKCVSSRGNFYKQFIISK